MAWRIQDHVLKGEIDNRSRGFVTGRIWLTSREEPITLELRGNCRRDLAGCLMHFENPSPIHGEPCELNAIQRGATGDMTASRKVRVLDVPVEEAMRLGRQGLRAPEHQANSLYLEWYSEANGRVLIESADYKITISPPDWTLTPEEEQEQIDANAQAFQGFLKQFGDNALPPRCGRDDEKPMDEFEYEQFLRENDLRSEKYGELLEKYGEQPGGDAIIDREMGWDQDTEEADFWDDDGAIDELGDPEPLEPNPASEGIDWVRVEGEHIRHPLVERVSACSAEMFRRCRDLGHLDEGGDPDAQEMLFQFQAMRAKLAGALNSLGYREAHPLERGGIIARLKRALNYLHLSINAAEKLAGKNLLTGEMLEAFRTRQFEVREQILALMKHFRESP